MDAGNLSKIENGHAMPTKRHLEALFEKLGINPNSLITIFLADFRILIMIAIQYYELGDSERAVTILYGLKKNVEAHCIDKIERGKRYPQVIYNLTKCLNQMGKREDEVIKLCNLGKAVCLETGYLWHLPHISMNEACARYDLEDYETCEKLLRDIVHTLNLYERHHEKNLTKKYAKDKLGIDL